MAPAVGASDFRAGHSEGMIFVPGHRPGDAVEVGGPTAPALELVVSFVERGVATRAGVDAFGGVVLVEFA